jgi:hypothetical protein
VLVQVLTGRRLPYGLQLRRVILAYWIAGTAIALVLALAHPLARSRFGSFVLGFVLGWFVYAICGILNSGWDTSFLLVAVFPALLVGGGWGIVAYDEEHPASSPG